MEDVLSPNWSIFWFAASRLFVVYGIYRLSHLIKDRRDTLPILAMLWAFIFVLSSLRIPSRTCRCANPTGTGLEIIIFGPGIMSVLSDIILDKSTIRIRKNLLNGDEA